MTKSQLFKAAHKLTKTIIQTGDSYSATFGLCLKHVITESKKAVKVAAKKVKSLYAFVTEDYAVTHSGDVLCLIYNEVIYSHFDIKKSIEFVKTITE